MAKRGEKVELTKEHQQIVEQNLNLARKAAWAMSKSTGIDYETLEGVAFEGLCHAVARYDPKRLHPETGKPLKLSSLAMPWIRGSLLHYCRDKTYAIRLTHRMRELWVKGRRLLLQGEGDIKIAKELGITLTEWQDVKTACSGPPLELKDQARPTDALEPEELDHLTPFREEASEVLSRLPPSVKAKLTKFATGRSDVPSVALLNELKAHLC